jgi:hypothetical protein
MASLLAGIGRTDGTTLPHPKRYTVLEAANTHPSPAANQAIAHSLTMLQAGGSDAASAGMALKRGPVKKPARALQKLVRLYRPCNLPPTPCSLHPAPCTLPLIPEMLDGPDACTTVMWAGTGGTWRC